MPHHALKVHNIITFQFYNFVHTITCGSRSGDFMASTISEYIWGAKIKLPNIYFAK